MEQTKLLEHLVAQVEGESVMSITVSAAMLIKMCADEGGEDFKTVTCQVLRHLLSDLEGQVIVHEG